MPDLFNVTSQHADEITYNRQASAQTNETPVEICYQVKFHAIMELFGRKTDLPIEREDFDGDGEPSDFKVSEVEWESEAEGKDL